MFFFSLRSLLYWHSVYYKDRDAFYHISCGHYGIGVLWSVPPMHHLDFITRGFDQFLPRLTWGSIFLDCNHFLIRLNRLFDHPSASPSFPARLRIMRLPWLHLRQLPKSPNSVHPMQKNDDKSKRNIKISCGFYYQNWKICFTSYEWKIGIMYMRVEKILQMMWLGINVGVWYFSFQWNQFQSEFPHRVCDLGIWHLHINGCTLKQKIRFTAELFFIFFTMIFSLWQVSIHIIYWNCLKDQDIGISCVLPLFVCTYFCSFDFGKKTSSC